MLSIYRAGTRICMSRRRHRKYAKPDFHDPRLPIHSKCIFKKYKFPDVIHQREFVFLLKIYHLERMSSTVPYYRRSKV